MVAGIILLILFWRAVLFCKQLPLEDKAVILEILKHNYGYLIFTIILFLAFCVSLFCQVIRFYIHPIRRLVEETTLIQTTNPNHRIKPQGGKFVQLLAHNINVLSESLSITQDNVAMEVAASKAEIEKERNILASFIGELQEGVLICTAEGRIIFYNKRAKELFSRENLTKSDETSLQSVKDPTAIRARDKYVGVGRSVFNIIDKNLIVHALDEVANKLHKYDEFVVSSFIVATRRGVLLRIETVPVLNKLRQLTGFVFNASDITERLHKENRLDMLMQSLVKGIRASVGGIRSSIETVLAYPDMDTTKLDQFRQIIHNESLKLGELTDQTVIDYPGYIHSRWPLVPMRVHDLIETVSRKAKEILNITISQEEDTDEYWIEVESYCALLVILFVLNQLKKEKGLKSFTCHIEDKDGFINIDMSWSGGPMLIKTLRQWEQQPLKLKGEGLALSLKEVLRHHGASIWSYSSKEANNTRSCLRFIFPATEYTISEVVKNITILTEETQPAFYDFDLFNQQGQTAIIDNRLLTELEYTVFDTETTGLAPRQGDEIVSIGAVRMINQQLLHEELFDQLVDPQRPLPLESIKIHGITAEMLEDQPTISQVLPLFHQFCDDTILVAHNAAFDMLLLKMKEAETGVSFINPVLDTLLLWEVLHPAQQRHNFSAIAELLGVRIVGRHTALGDALATAEVFSKMIPLLNKKGILTLKDARLASQKTSHARLKY